MRSIGEVGEATRGRKGDGTIARKRSNESTPPQTSLLCVVFGHER